ncbi:MAG: NAD-dependent epimerase/dehydratase family protein [Bryobacteraceae bacterium]|jgi:nucleoside-diphosphate-sugar epimerase
MPAGIQNLAIFGAAGAIGCALAPELVRRGIPFRAVGRRRQTLADAFGGMAGAEILDADLSDPEQADRAAQGVDTIVYAVGVPFTEFDKHPVLMRITLEAAARAGVARLMLVTGIYSYGVPRTPRVAETHPREPESHKGKCRKQQEDLVTEAHQHGGLRTMVVRLPDFYGPHTGRSLAARIFHSALEGKTATWLGPASTPHEFIFVPDAAPVLADLAGRQDCYGEAWNLGGVETIAGIDFVTRVYRAAGRDPNYRSMGRTMMRIEGAVSPTVKELVELLYLQETPVILDDRKLAATLGVLAKTSYDDGIRGTLEWMRAQ